MMLNVAAGVILAAFVCGLFYAGLRLNEKGERGPVHGELVGFVMMVVAIGLAITIVIGGWSVS